MGPRGKPAQKLHRLRDAVFLYPKFPQASLDGIVCLAAIGPTGKPAQKLQHWRAVVFLYLKFSQASLENFRYKKASQN